VLLSKRQKDPQFAWSLVAAKPGSGPLPDAISVSGALLIELVGRYNGQSVSAKMGMATDKALELWNHERKLKHARLAGSQIDCKGFLKLASMSGLKNSSLRRRAPFRPMVCAVHTSELQGLAVLVAGILTPHTVSTPTQH
jgi:hypothetical protein